VDLHSVRFYFANDLGLSAFDVIKV
jgi:hypothetical protein